MFQSVAILEDHHLAHVLFAVLQQAGFHPAPIEEASSIMPHQ